MQAMPPPKNTRKETIETQSPKRRRLSRSAAAGRTMSYDKRYHPMDDVTRPASAAALRAAYGLDTPRSSSPFNRRGSRGNDKPSMYDMAYHPLDEVISPKASKAKVPRTESQDIPPSSLPIGWKSLEGCDRLLYSLQKGAPLDSTILPMTWPEVAQALYYDAEELKQDYTTICIQLQHYYGVGPEPTTRAAQELYYAEGFDVYDAEVGDKYWEYRKDNVVLSLDLPIVFGNSDSNSNSDDDRIDGLSGSYNDAEGYIRQSLGRFDSDTQESPETEILASLRHQVSTSIDDILEPGELTAMFQSSADHDEERSTAQPGFSVHEDQPGNTPRAKQQLALHPQSPGIDHPKENWRERSPADP
ncbi:MAG: hypothetical protein Q9213_005373 [Squamulea squamosa]